MDSPRETNLFHSAVADPQLSNTPPQASPQFQEPEQLLPPPDFKPLFTLVDDPNTGEHCHPTVHYLFADDDPEILISATLEALDGHEKSGPASSEEAQAGAEERFIVLDLGADGKTVTSVCSLSPEWQALTTAVTQAPSWGDDIDERERGLMLRISGQEATIWKGDKVDRPQGGRGSSLDNAVAEFGRRLAGLDQVIGPVEIEDKEPLE